MHLEMGLLEDRLPQHPEHPEVQFVSFFPYFEKWLFNTRYPSDYQTIRLILIQTIISIIFGHFHRKSS